MAIIIKTTPKNQKRFLLKAGLSIFLFLQIQLPTVTSGSLKKVNHWSFELCRHAKNAYCVKGAKPEPHLALARHQVKL